MSKNLLLADELARVVRSDDGVQLAAWSTARFKEEVQRIELRDRHERRSARNRRRR